MEQLQPALIPISSNPPLKDTQEVVLKMRNFSAYLRDNYEYPRPFEGWYMRGEIPHKQGHFPDHQRTNDIPEFKPVDMTTDLEEEAPKPESES